MTESFSGVFFCANMFAGMSSQILGEKFGISVVKVSKSKSMKKY